MNKKQTMGATLERVMADNPELFNEERFVVMARTSAKDGVGISLGGNLDDMLIMLCGLANTLYEAYEGKIGKESVVEVFENVAKAVRILFEKELKENKLKTGLSAVEEAFKKLIIDPARQQLKEEHGIETPENITLEELTDIMEDVIEKEEMKNEADNI